MQNFPNWTTETTFTVPILISPRQGLTDTQFGLTKVGNISAHQSISRNIISDSVFIFMNNSVDSKFVSYLSI